MFKIYFIIPFIVFTNFSVANDTDDCGNNEQARALAKLIKTDKNQKRNNIRCNIILTKAAVDKAKKMSEFGLVLHNLGGSPNSRLRAANYELPDYYGTDFNSNQVEAISGGYSDADEVWDAFKRSDSHRIHLLGEHEFYVEQDEIGIAFIKNLSSPHVEYWAVYLTKGAKDNKSTSNHFNEIPNKSMFFLHKEKK
jgi:uncharacterized protein YkwD